MVVCPSVRFSLPVPTQGDACSLLLQSVRDTSSLQWAHCTGGGKGGAKMRSLESSNTTQETYSSSCDKQSSSHWCRRARLTCRGLYIYQGISQWPATPLFPCDLEEPPGLGSRGDFSSTLSQACKALSCCEWVFCQWCQITRGSFLQSDLLLLLIGDRAETIQLIFLRTASWSGGSPSSKSPAHAFLTQQLYSSELKKMSMRRHLMDWL